MEQQTIPPPMPKNWLVESILVTLFCCLPFGIAGIVYAAQVSSLYASQQYDAAAEASKNAAKWTKIGFWVGIGVIALYFLLVVGLGVGAGIIDRYR